MSKPPIADLTPEQIEKRRAGWREAKRRLVWTPEMRARLNQHITEKRHALRASMTVEEWALRNKRISAARNVPHKAQIEPSKWADLCVRNALAASRYKKRKIRARDRAFMEATRRAAPRYLPPDMRDDVIAAVLLRYGERPKRNSPRPTIDDIPVLMKEAIRDHNRQFSTFDYVSLDAPIRGTDGLRLIDTIEAERLHL